MSHTCRCGAKRHGKSTAHLNGCHTLMSKLAKMVCHMLQCVAVCCSVLQCVAVCCSVLQCVAVCCSLLQCVAVCCSVTSTDTILRRASRQRWCVPWFGSGMCCSMLQHVAACCNVLQCVAGCHSPTSKSAKMVCTLI